MMNISEKVIVVTGAGSGLGRELALGILSKGGKVAAVDINEKGLKETVKLAGKDKDKIIVYTLDITDKSKVGKFPAKVIKDFGCVDGVINNAGIIQPFVRINDLEYEAIDRVFKINFFGTLHMTKSFLPHLLARPEAHVVNVSSMGGFLPVPGQTIYGASKAAVKLFTEGLYSELLDTGVRVTIVFPGAMSTNIAANSGLKFKRSENDNKGSSAPLSPDKAAEIVLSGMEKNSFRVLVGSDAGFMDFLCRLSPKFAADFIFKKMKALLS